MRISFLSTIALLVFWNYANSQPLTNRQIFDFDPGDVIQKINRDAYRATQYPSVFETLTILNKKVSAQNDTFFYVSRVDKYSPPWWNNPTSFSSDTVVSFITNLDSFPNHYNKSICPYDVFSIDTCGRKTWKRRPLPADSCLMGYIYHVTWFIEGLGGPFFNYTDEEGERKSSELVYYKKNSDSCGTFQSSIEEQSSLQLPLLFPNPAHSEFYIDITDPGLLNLRIIDLAGKVHLERKIASNSPIKTDNLADGIYLVELSGSRGKWVSRLVVIH